jgi:hypothetical protein
VFYIHIRFHNILTEKFCNSKTIPIFDERLPVILSAFVNSALQRVVFAKAESFLGLP